VRRRDDGPHRQHAREDALGDDGDRGLGHVLRQVVIAGQNDIRRQRGHEHDLTVVKHLHRLRRRREALLEDARDQVDINQRIAPKEGQCRCDVIVRNRLDRPASFDRQCSHGRQ